MPRHTKPTRVERGKDPSEQLSRKLTAILRHGKDGFKDRISPAGWLPIQELITRSNYCQTNNITHADISQAVKNCPKQRFKISDDLQQIKATQGHTISISDDSLTEITLEKAHTYDAVCHGTYYKVLNLIQQYGLCKMKRQHIHMTASDRVDASIGVISGFRASTEVLVYIDIVKAVSEGLKFFVSENNVILCAGNQEGYLLPQYFKKIVDRKTGTEVMSKHSNSSSTSTDKKKLENLAKNLRKKLKSIEALKKQTGGLNQEQLEKVASEPNVRNKLNETIESLKQMK